SSRRRAFAASLLGLCLAGGWTLRAEGGSVLGLLQSEVEQRRHLLLVEGGLRRHAKRRIHVGNVELDAVALGGVRQKRKLGVHACLLGARNHSSQDENLLRIGELELRNELAVDDEVELVGRKLLAPWLDQPSRRRHEERTEHAAVRVHLGKLFGVALD